MAGQPSVISDYISIILRTIQQAENDPAQLRGLVYDIARISLGKQVLSSYREIGSAGLQRHMLDLEVAIKNVERLSYQESDLGAYRLDEQLLGKSVSHEKQSALTILDQPYSTKTDITKWDKSTLLVHETPTQFYRESPNPPEVLQRIEVWEPAFSRGRKRDWWDRWPKAELVIAALIGVAIYAVVVIRSDYLQQAYSSRLEQRSVPMPAVSALPNSHKNREGVAGLNSPSASQALDFPLPSVYGVYAVNGGKLYELASLPIRVPDPRVAISAIISSPVQVTIPNGKLSFVIFRRDLVASAPDEVFIRVIARVVREMKFGAGSPTTTRIDDQWAIRGKSLEFRVAPLGDNPEMVVMRPKDADFSFSPGRYALVVKGQGYDFSVAGQMTDTAQCLERTEAANGTIYSECRSLP